MKTKNTLRSFLLACSSLLAISSLHAADGTWTTDANGNWADLANWNSGVGPIADGADFTALLDDVITGNRTITNDGRTIGNITAADTTHNYTIASGTLTLDVTSGSPTLSVPSGRTLTISSVVAGADGFTKTGDGTATMSANNTVTGDVIVSGGLVNFASGNITFDSLSGSGDFFRLGGNVTTSILDGSAFTGNLATLAGGNGQTIQFQSMGDAVGSGNLITRGGSGDSNQLTRFNLYGDVGPVTFNNRAIEIRAKGATPSNWSSKISYLGNQNATPANAWVINTDLVNETDRDHELILEGSNIGDNTFDGVISDSTGIGGLGAFYSTQTGGLSVIKEGAGKWILSGVNTYTAAATNTAAGVGTIVRAGTLVIGGAGQLGSGTYGESISIASGTELIVDSSAANNFTGPITGLGTLIQDGAGTLTLGDGTNNASLSDFMTLSVETGSVLNLNYLAGNTDAVLNLNLGGTAMLAGEYGHTDSGANNGGDGVGFYDAFFEPGTGIINNLGGDTTSIGIAFYDGGNADLVGPGDAASSQTGGGTWDATIKNWDIGTVDRAAWLNTTTSEAVFGGAISKTVTLGSDVNVGTMTMLSRNYVFNGSDTITFGPTGVIDAQTPNNRTQLTEFNCNVAGGDITLTGTGFVRIDGTATFSSFTMSTTGTSGGVGELPGGTYNGFGPGVLTINSGGFFVTNNDKTTINNNMVWNGNWKTENVSAAAKINEWNGNVTLGADITVSSKHAQVFNGIISDGGNDHKLTLTNNNGGSTITLSNANTFGGGVQVNQGTLNINNASAIGSGTLTLNATSVVLDNTSGNPITLSTNNVQAWNQNFAFTGTNDLNMGTGGVTMNANRIVTVTAGTLTVGGAIGQSGGTRTLGKAGNGTLVLSGANSYAGNTTVTAGTLALVGGSQDSAITVNSGAFLGFTLGSPTTSTKALNLNTGHAIRITGTPTLASYTLITALSIGGTGTPTLESPITGYELVVDGTALKLNATGPSSPYDTWAAGFLPDDVSDPTLDFDNDGLTNLQEFAFGTNPTTATGAITLDGAGNVINGKGSPIAHLQEITEDGVDFRAIFSRRKDPVADGLVYTVQFSTELDEWVDYEFAPGEPILLDDSDSEIDVMYVPFPLAVETSNGFEKPHFVRVGVEFAP